MSPFVAEGERTEESREPEGQSPEDERRATRIRRRTQATSGSPSSTSSTRTPRAARPSPADGVGDWDPPHEQEDESKFSDVDAMGQEKRRTIIGQGYGPSRGRQLLYYGLFIAFLVAAFIGGSIAVSELDKAPAKDPDAAPWAGTQVPAKQFE